MFGDNDFIIEKVDEIGRLRARVTELEARLATLEAPPVVPEYALVLAPSDTSPVAELVRAAVAYHEHNGDVMEPHDETALRLLDAGEEAAEDPAVRAWVERGRK